MRQPQLSGFQQRYYTGRTKFPKLNFEVDITWEYGWKHFFGFCDDKLSDANDTLFICIVRHAIDWFNSIYRKPWHLAFEFLRDGGGDYLLLVSTNRRSDKFSKYEMRLPYLM